MRPHARAKLGFGFLRLPKIGGGIDLQQLTSMVDRFLEGGFRYFDTAFAYKGSEEALRASLVNRHPRGRFEVASKLCAWQAKNRAEAMRQFDISLAQTGAGYFDAYLLHALGRHRTQAFEDFGSWDFCLRKKQEGRIRSLGFSFHGTAKELDAILARHPEVEFVQLQINYADWEDAGVQSRKCYETAIRHQNPIIVMEPVKGGLLADATPIQGGSGPGRRAGYSAAALALRFAANLPGVEMVLSGMSSLSQMEENIRIFQALSPLSDAENRLIGEMRDNLARLKLIPCSGCEYCAAVCPKNVGISIALESINISVKTGDVAPAEEFFMKHLALKGAESPEECAGCGKCERACPQSIPIREKIRYWNALLANERVSRKAMV